jgi:hypothetical protein
MKPPKEAVFLTTALVVFSEATAPRETNQALAPQQPHDHKEILVNHCAIGDSISPITPSNSQHQYAVAKVQDDPEIFWLFAIRHPEFKNGQTMKDFGNFTESEMRAELYKLACSQNESTFLIAKARMNE